MMVLLLFLWYASELALEGHVWSVGEAPSSSHEGGGTLGNLYSVLWLVL